MDEQRNSPDETTGDSPQRDAPPPEALSNDSAGQDSREADPISPRQSFKRKHWGKLLLISIAMLPVLVFAVWSIVTLNWTYSEGPRPGYVQKIARKGFVCKTWEGIMYPELAGFRADSFQFTVRNDSIAHLLQNMIGKHVSLEYQQHIGVPTSCFGDSQYFIVGVRELTK